MPSYSSAFSLPLSSSALTFSSLTPDSSTPLPLFSLPSVIPSVLPLFPLLPRLLFSFSAVSSSCLLFRCSSLFAGSSSFVFCCSSSFSSCWPYSWVFLLLSPFPRLRSIPLLLLLLPRSTVSSDSSLSSSGPLRDCPPSLLCLPLPFLLRLSGILRTFRLGQACKLSY